MNFSKIPWTIPGNTYDGMSIAANLQNLGFVIIAEFGPVIEVTPPDGWTAAITGEGDGYQSGVIFDKSGRCKVECVQSHDPWDDKPPTSVWCSTIVD